MSSESNNTVVVSMRLDKEVVQRIDDAAAKESRKRGNFLILLISDALKAYERRKKKK